jgi:membrane-associated phospholipid phosphatase
LKSFFKNNLLVLLFYFSITGIATYFIASYEKNAVHLFINQFVGNRYLNLFFFYVTYLGDGRFAAFLLLIIVIYNMRTGIYAIFSFVLATIISTALKYLFFDDVNRPHYIFQYIDVYPLKFVEGVHMHIHNSFPSGHATQAFAILMCLVYMNNNHLVKLLFFFLALITAASRVYLSQHWLEDITAGSFIGVFCSALFYFILIHRNMFARLNRPLADVRKSQTPA